MKHLALAGALALALTSAANCEPMKLTVEKALNVYASLARLRGEPGPDGRLTPYKIDTDTFYAILVDISQLDPVFKSYQAALKAAFDDVSKSHEGDLTKGDDTHAPTFKPGSEGAKELDARMQKVADAEQTVELNRIKYAGLHVGPDPAKQNQFDPSALVGLLPILDQ